MTLIELAVLIPVFMLGYLGGGLVGAYWHGLRYGREQRSKMNVSSLRPFGYSGGILAVAAALVHWHAFGL